MHAVINIKASAIRCIQFKLTWPKVCSSLVYKNPKQCMIWQKFELRKEGVSGTAGKGWHRVMLLFRSSATGLFAYDISED